MEYLNRYIYLACPYSDDKHTTRLERFERVTEVSGKLMSQGWVVYSPITHSHPIAVRTRLPKGWEFWGKADRVFIHHCLFLVVLMLPGWDTSHGVAEELKLAKEYNKPVLYLTPDCRWHYPRVRYGIVAKATVG